MYYKYFGYLIVMLAFFLASVSYGEGQEVYLYSKDKYKETGKTFYKLVCECKSKWVNGSKIIEYLLKKEILVKITSEIATKELGITWLDNDLGEGYINVYNIFLEKQEIIGEKMQFPYKYPKLVVHYLDDKVGYDLTPAEDIYPGDIIAEYAGDHLIFKKGDFWKGNPYSVKGSEYPSEFGYKIVNAEFKGNAARYANHAQTEAELGEYQYKFKSPGMLKEVVMANSKLMFMLLPLPGNKYYFGNNKVALIATKHIKAFGGSIVYSYGPDYGYRRLVHPTAHPDEPCLFDGSGDVIPRDQYEIQKVGVIFLNKLREDNTVFFVNTEKFMQDVEITDGYRIISIDVGDSSVTIIVNAKEWDDELKKIKEPRNRLSMSGHFIFDDDELTKTKKFKEAFKKKVNAEEFKTDKEKEGVVKDLVEWVNSKK